MVRHTRSLGVSVFVLSALACAGCFLDRGGIASDPQRDSGPPPDGSVVEQDADVLPPDAGPDAGPCTPSGAELCDGLDNDCDPATADGADEATLGDACDDPEDADLCPGGAIACNAGALACAGDDGDTASEVELCDGIDNDCDPATADGAADPGAGGACDDADADLCAEGVSACVDGALACTGDDGDNADEVELCDGVDNDCDPATADGAAEDWIDGLCDDGDLDLCPAGTFACTGGAMVCTGDDGDRASEVEVCDGVDNDCNAATADGASDPMLGTACDDGDADLCPEGTRSCAGGSLICTGDDGDQLGEVERCDGVDNDCNPLTLDGAAEPLGARCDGPDLDMCNEGMVTGCVGGVLACSDVSGDSVETCNGRDDDCDATIDEGTTCPGGCTRVTRTGGGSYLFCVAAVTWTSARDACRAVGAVGPTEGAYELVTIGDVTEQRFVVMQATALSAAAWWIGLNDRASEDSYRWVADDSALGAYRGWESGQPNDPIGVSQDCVSFEPTDPTAGGDPGGWNDYGCEVTTSYVCEAFP